MGVGGVIAGPPQPLIVMVAAVKEIVPARYGFKLVVKHVPDQGFVLEGSLYRRLERCFAGDLSLWGTVDNVQLVVIATFSVDTTGTPKLQELALMEVTNEWLPIEDAFERQRLIPARGNLCLPGIEWQTRAQFTQPRHAAV